MKLDLHVLWSAKYAKWIIIGLISLFSLLIVYEIVSIFISTYPAETTSVESTASPIKTKPNHSLKNTLFGEYVPKNLNEAHVRKSMLNVNLVGVLLAVPESESQVIIRLANGDEKVFKVGDNIPGGVVIKSIMAHGVLVEHRGVLESISLPKEELTIEPQPKPLNNEE